MANKITLHRTGWEGWPEYNCYHNGRHYEVVKYPGYSLWNVSIDGTPVGASYWLKEIRESIAAGDYEK